MAMALTTSFAAIALALTLVMPARASAGEIHEQPPDVRRPDVVQIEWAGEAGPVAVERRHGLAWVVEASDEAGDVLVEESSDGRWSARWQPTYYSPVGTYRIRLEGDDDTLTSDEFRVRPCLCVIPGVLRSRWRKARFRLSLKAEYARGPAAGYRELPARVTTGRPIVRVFRDGRRIGSVRLRYRRGKFRGSWRGRRGPRAAVVFQLVALSDGFGNR
jgi:hypothetical protein